jgi:NADPH:quinone reductase-like Zn-dependent oxidoreductase
LALAKSGVVSFKIHGSYKLEEVAKAHADLESGQTFGKLILQIE